MRRGELWWLDFGGPIGSAPCYERPGVIVSVDSFNTSAIGTLIVVPLYSNLKYARHAGNVILRTTDTGLAVDSVANVSQVGSIDRQQIIRRVGAVPPSALRDIDSGFRLALQL